MSTPSLTPARPERPVTRRGAPLAAMGLGWLLVYALVAIGPLVVALTADPPPGRSFTTELSAALGFVGLSMLGLQFVSVSRFTSLAAPFGLDAVLRFHRQISFVALAFIIAHPAILAVERTPALLDPIGTHWTGRMGILATLAVVAVVVTSVWRRRLGLRYETWRVLHGVLATVAVGAALAHVGGVGHYVSGPAKTALWVALSLAFVALLVRTRIVEPLRDRRRPWTITGVEPEADGVWTVSLEPDGHPGLRFMPGQFAWLRVGPRATTIHEHPFSFSSSAEQAPRISFTIKEAGDFTARVGELTPGTRAYVDGPYGAFTYERNEGFGFVFVAGGAGIAPVMSMLRTLADRGDQRPCLLIHANPEIGDVVFREELRAMRARLDLRIVEVLEHPPPGWEGESGLVDADLLDRHLPTPPGRHRYFLCGPEPMTEAVGALLLARDVAPEHVEFERFDLV